MALGPELLAILSQAGRVCVGLVFLLAATQKAQHWRIFFGVIANYRLLPRVMVAPAAALLPPLEMIVGLLLLSAMVMPWGELAAVLLLALFAAAMAINLRRGHAHIDCGCGQSFLAQTLSWTLVARNAVLAALLLPSLAPIGPLTMPAALTGVGAGLAFFLLYLLFNALSALPRPDARGHRFA
ncbi:MAG TPA: MauE/DoxX family redox-associated membrane protein [Rhizomicrobium sp.]|nr:MauE/DoxX family redox-associated membrane protein [Rhizomicrobium sp.]